MKSTITKNIIFIILLIFSFEGCKKNKGEFLKQKKELNNDKEYYLDLYFPDTVSINNIYEGEIIYMSPLDTITTEILKKGDTMRIMALFLKDNERHIKDSYEHILNSKEIDTFIPNNSNNIPIKYKFKKLGVNYLEGVLEDKVYLKDSDTSKLRIISRHSHITLPIFVTDDDNIIDSYFKENSIRLPIRI
ncbi:hypothetical protein [Winogradskyella sp. MIT101101]|uniref:hypothetical protein n=1 Tax=Winogradskyella sp. MIT101101 TaxID=3098297 RepID=UPI003999CC8B